MRKTSARTILRLAVPWVALWVLIPASAAANQLTVYPARRIITMDPSLPSATAVAVRDDRIVAVGTMEMLEPWLEAFDYEIDETFRDKVLLPGFIDPHLHPDLAVSLLARNEIITPEDWDLPSGFIEGVTDRAGYLARLRELVDRDPDSDKTFFTWGYNAFWHGLITRQDLDAISATRPIVVTQRSSHEVVLNTAALAAAQLHRLGRVEVDQQHLDLTAVAGVHGAGRVDDGDAVPGGQPRARVHETAVPLRQREGDPGRHQRALPRREHDVDRGVQVGAGVAGVRVGRERQRGVQPDHGDGQGDGQSNGR